MRKLGIGTGALAGALLTAPFIAILYLTDELAGLPYLPFDFLTGAPAYCPARWSRSASIS